MSTPFIATAVLSGLLFFRERNWLTGSILTLSLVGVGLVHYPAYAVVALAGFLFLVSSFIVERGRVVSNQPRQFLLLFLPLILSLILIGANVFVTKKETPKVETVSSRQTANAYHEKNLDSAEVLAYQEETNSDKELTVNRAINPLVSAKSLIAEYTAYTKSLPKNSGMLLLGVLIISIYWLLVSNPTRQESRYYHRLLSSLIASALLIAYLLTLYPISGLGTSRDTGILLLPLLSVLPLAWLLASISGRRWLEIITIISVATVFSVGVFQIFQKKSSSPFVDSYDVTAFQWINQNIGKSEKFIGTSALDPRRKTIVFPTDGSLWVPVFTGNKIANPFHDLGFVSVESHLNYEYTRRISTGSDEEAINALNYYKGHGYRYIYVDGPQAKEALGIDRLQQLGKAEIVYSNQQILIVKII